MNYFKIGCFSFEERLGVHMKITQAAHNRRKIVGATSGDLGLGGGCQSTLSGGGFFVLIKCKMVFEPETLNAFDILVAMLDIRL